MSRVLKGLREARLLPGKPSCIPVSRPRGVKALGVRYERALAGELPGARQGLWWGFVDANGPGYCQTDWIFAWQDRLVVLEAKLTYTEEAWKQLERLYLPVVGKATGWKTLGVQVTRRLLPGFSGFSINESLEQALEAASHGRACWHWLGAPGARPRLADLA